DAAISFLEGVCHEAPEPADPGRMVALWALGWIATMAARPRDAARWAGQLGQVDSDGPKLGVSWGHYIRGLAHYELNQAPEPRDALLAADRLRGAAHRLALRNSLLGLARVEQAADDLAATSDILHGLKDLPEMASAPGHLAVIGIFEARLAATFGDL